MPRCVQMGENIKRYKKVEGPYNDPDVKQGSLGVYNPLDLLCLDFTTMDSSSNGKENVLIVTDAFSIFSVAVVTPNQQAKTVGKALTDR